MRLIDACNQFPQVINIRGCEVFAKSASALWQKIEVLYNPSKANAFSLNVIQEGDDGTLVLN
jgi:hypothetical protein